MQILQITNAAYPATPTVRTTAITGLGSATIQTLAPDRKSNVWVATYTDPSGTGATAVMQIILNGATAAASALNIAGFTNLLAGAGPRPHMVKCCGAQKRMNPVPGTRWSIGSA